MPPCSKLPREASGGLNEEDTSFLSFMLDTSPTRASVRKWPEDLKAQRKMELHSKRMARFRSRKTTELHMMQNEHKRLDRELEDRIDALRRAGVCGASLVQNELQRLVLEREMLRQESIELQQEIAKHLKFQQIIQSSSETLVPRVSPANCLSNCKSNVGSFTVRRIESLWTPVEEEAGRHVEFTGGEPPFFFHPFSRQEFDQTLSFQEQRFVHDSGNLSFAGMFLGWEVRHAPLIANRNSNLLLGWARYSKRTQSSIEQIQKAMCRPDGSNEWPILLSARNLGRTGDIALQTLQQFDENSRVIVRNYPGEVCYRYLGLVQCSKWEEENGKRVLKYSFAIANSEANARSRSAEPTCHKNVQWVQEGGAFLTITEVSIGVVDVQFNYWACCKSELHSKSHFLMFGHMVTRWERLVAPFRLLQF